MKDDVRNWQAHRGSRCPYRVFQYPAGPRSLSGRCERAQGVGGITVSPAAAAAIPAAGTAMTATGAPNASATGATAGIPYAEVWCTSAVLPSEDGVEGIAMRGRRSSASPCRRTCPSFMKSA